MPDDLPTLSPGDRDPARHNTVTRQAVQRILEVQATANGALQASNNLSDLANIATALANLGLATTITEVGDADHTILPTEWIIVTSAALTAPRTWTLPAASAVAPWHPIFVFDRKGVITATNTLTIARAGAGPDTIDDLAFNPVLTTAYSGGRFNSNQSSKWTYDLAIADYGVLLDRMSTTRGAIAYRGSGNWAGLAPGTSGHVVTSNGAGADPSYQAIPAASAPMTNVGSVAASSGTTASLTNIPVCKTLFVGYQNISHNSGSNQTLRFALSTNNGSSYGTAQNMFSTAVGAAVSGAGILQIMNLDTTANFPFSATYVAQVLGGVETVSSGAINAIQFSWSGGSFDDGSGKFYVYCIK